MKFSGCTSGSQGKRGLLDMATFADFYKHAQETLPLAGPSGEPSASGTQTAAANAVVLGLDGVDMSNSDVVKFAGQVGELVIAEPFLNELSCKIGQPTPGESEDEFVARCKQTMFGLLAQRLD
jgi:hypothetical protein